MQVVAALRAVLVLALALCLAAQGSEATGAAALSEVVAVDGSVSAPDDAVAPVCAVTEERLAAEVALSKELRGQKALLEQSLVEAQEKIKDLQRAVERKKNEVVTAESVLKVCELDKTSATESVTKHKEVVAMLGREVEGLKSQVQLANQKSVAQAQQPKCPACPSAPVAAAGSKGEDCPKCPKCAKSGGGAACEYQQCAAFLASEAQSAAQAAHIFATVTVPKHWDAVGAPAVASAWAGVREAFNTSAESVLKPLYAQHVEPHYSKHVRPHVSAAWAFLAGLYQQHLALFVEERLLPAYDEAAGRANWLLYRVYTSLELEDLPLNLWLGFAKAVRGTEQGLQWAADKVATADPRLAAVAPTLVHGALLLVLFLCRRYVFGLLAALVIVLMTPVLLLTWPFRSRKPKAAKKSGSGGGGGGAKPGAAPPAQGRRNNANGTATLGRPPPFPPVSSAGLGKGLGLGQGQGKGQFDQGHGGSNKEEAVWGDGEPLTTQAALDALRSYERDAQDEL